MPNPLEKIVAYHYTNDLHFYQGIMHGVDYGRKGLLPIGRFINFDVPRLPAKAYEGVTVCLSEPRPKSWVENTEFPYAWAGLMFHIRKARNVMLLSFDLLPTDKAYVVEKAHIERIKSPGRNLTERVRIPAHKKYWESRVPVKRYKGNYSLPELIIFNPVELERLRIEWTKPADKVRKETEEIRKK